MGEAIPRTTIEQYATTLRDRGRQADHTDADAICKMLRKLDQEQSAQSRAEKAWVAYGKLRDHLRRLCDEGSSERLPWSECTGAVRAAFRDFLEALDAERQEQPAKPASKMTLGQT